MKTMKKLFFTAGVMMLISIMLASSIFGAGRLAVETKESAIVLDGVRDDGYGAPVKVELQGAAHTDGLEVTTGTLSCAWQGDTLYFYMDIADTTPNAWSATDWQNDGPEFFIDLLNTQPESFDDDCVRIRVLAAVTDGDPTWAGQMFSFNGSNNVNPVPAVTIDDVAVVVKPSSDTGWKDGYSVEMSYKTPYTMKDGQVIGFDCQIVDDVFGTGARDSQAFLGDPDDVVWSTPARFGAELVLTAAAVAAPAPEAAPTEATVVDEPAQTAVAPAAVVTTAPATADFNVTLIMMVISLAAIIAVRANKRPHR